MVITLSIYYTFLKHDFVKPNVEEVSFIHSVLINTQTVKFNFHMRYNLRTLHIPEAHFPMKMNELHS